MATPRHIGPYEILEVLADGGMGVVYRARHRERGQLAALKAVRVADPRMLAAIRHELYALSRLDHPGIVRVLDAGVATDLGPWFAMELVDGVTLDAFARDRLWGGSDILATASLTSSSDTLYSAPSDAVVLAGLAQVIAESAAAAQQPAPRPLARVTLDALTVWQPSLEAGDALLLGEGLREVLGVVAALARTLAWLHGQGVVHRDLKPHNILVGADGLPRIIDFGIATAFAGARGREALEVTSAFVGTPDYTAPEQIRGEYVDARADLYAVGCILYELLTGAPPFAAGGAPLQILMRHLSLEAPPVSTRSREPLPRALDTLVASLLAKDPRQRLGHAADLASALEALLERPLELAPAWRSARPCLYRPGLRGRDEALARLGPLCAVAGRHVVLVGASGVGRTRLAMELGRRAALQEKAQVVAVRCAEAPEPLGVIARVLLAMAEHAAAQGCLDEVFEPAAATVLGASMPRLAIHSGIAPAVDVADAAPPGEQRLCAAVAQTWTAFARLGPCVLVLDDLDLADEASLAVLAWLQRSGSLARAPGLALISARRADLAPSPSLARLLAAEQVLELELGPLDADAVGEMVGDMLALDTVPRDLADALAARSEGNPWFVCEMLQVAIEGGTLRRTAGAGWRFAGAPAAGETIDALLARRVSALAPPVLRILEAAAVLGQVFEEADLRAVTGVHEAAALHATVELEQRRLLELLSSGRLGFVNGRLREVVLSQLAPATLRELHWRCAEVLGERHPHDDGLAARIADHWLAAGDGLRAAEHYLRAARTAARGHALEAARRYYLAGLELAPPTLEATQARLDYARDVLKTRGEYPEAIAQLEQVCAESRAEGALRIHGQALRWLGVMHRYEGDRQRARGCFDAALLALERAGERAAQGDVLNSRGNLALDAGDLDGATRDFERALQLARAVHKRHQEAIVLGGLALVERGRGRLAGAHALHAQALVIHTELGGEYGRGLAHVNLAALCFLLGRPDEALAHYQAGFALLGAIGEARLATLAASYRALMLLALGRLDEAEASARDGLRLACGSAMATAEARAREALAAITLERGALDQAETQVRAALALREHVSDASREPAQRTLLAEVLARGGQLREARGQLAHAQALVETQPGGRARTLATTALVAALEGDTERAIRDAGAAPLALANSDDPAVRADVHLLVGEAFWRVGRAEQAREPLEQAHASCHALHMVLRRARAEVLLALTATHAEQAGPARLDHARELARTARLHAQSPLGSVLAALPP